VSCPCLEAHARARHAEDAHPMHSSSPVPPTQGPTPGDEGAADICVCERVDELCVCVIVCLCLFVCARVCVCACDSRAHMLCRKHKQILTCRNDFTWSANPPTAFADVLLLCTSFVIPVVLEVGAGVALYPGVTIVISVLKLTRAITATSGATALAVEITCSTVHTHRRPPKGKDTRVPA
jgi:hypothetical protein